MQRERITGYASHREALSGRRKVVRDHRDVSALARGRRRFSVPVHRRPGRRKRRAHEAVRGRLRLGAGAFAENILHDCGAHDEGRVP